MDISPHTIGYFLYGLKYQPPINTEDLDNQIEEMRKITQRLLGFENNIVLFRCMAERIASYRQNIVWVICGRGVASLKIEKNILNL